MSTDTCRWLFLLVFLATWTKYSNSKEIRVVCYYTNWSVYRPGTAKFSPQNINPYLCTHLIYAFGGFTKENTLKPFDKYQDIEKGGYAKFTGLKTYNKNLKTMLAIGGWNEGSSRFSPMVANPDRRKELIRNTIKFLRQNHFDGLDLDWEYPSFRDGGKSRDRDNYAQLVQEMREEFERESEKTGRLRLLLTMAVPAGIEYINKGYDVPKLTKYLDWMNILSYDYHSAFEPAVNHHAPLLPLEEPSEYNYDAELNIDYTIQHYLKKGADPNKLVLGIPTYGRSYTLFNPDANEMGAPADGPGDMGEATRENGYLAYYEICDYVKSQDWEVVDENPEAMGPYAYKDNQWVGYDDDAIARKKAEYVAENNLGGIMFWSIDNDDFRGNCHGKPYPIIEAAKEALISAYGLTDENLISPSTKPTKSKTRNRARPPSKSSIAKEESSEKKKVSTSSGSRRRNRVKSKSDDSGSANRAKIRRKESRTTEGPVYSSLELVTPSYTTPAPPSTPDLGGGFKCEDEGFYPHPKDCKKYYWCLSGPGELGIVAHQFTCPAGLYFNKAADSCDYTRNVLCNKKLSKTTTSTTEATTSTTPTTSTKRVPPKITAATSRTTVFRTSTTTEAYEDEYEYEDEDEFEDTKNSEEDPRVIKELLDLIKKAGGIEELERQLKIQEDGSASVSHPDATTPSAISKSLVARVLGKAAKNTGGRKNSYSFLNRNSRGPQNEGLKTTEEQEKQERGRPQYTTITRQRSRKTEDDEDESEKEIESSNSAAKKQPQYVNIRRGRVSTTTEEPEEDSKGQINRNKILGEDDDDEEDEEEEEAEDEEEKSTKSKHVTPHYVNIRRQRPSSTEGSTTSKYTIIRRGTTTEAEISQDGSEKRRGSTTTTSEDLISENKKRGTTTSDVDVSSTEKSNTKSKYKILRRGSTTESSVNDLGSTLSSKLRGSTSPSLQDVSETGSTTAATTTLSSFEEKYKILKRRGSTSPSIQDVSESGSTTAATTTLSSFEEKYKILKRRGSTSPSIQDVSETGSTTAATTTLSSFEEKYKILKRGSTTQASVGNEQTSPVDSTVKYLSIPGSSTTQETDITTLEAEDPTTVEQLLITSPESLTLKTPASLSSDKAASEQTKAGSKLSDTSGAIYQTQAPQLLEPRPFSLNPKTVTESSSRVTKVSDSNYKLRLRQKLPSTQTDIISTTTLTTEKPSPFRTRPSRFKQTTSGQVEQQTSKPTTSARSRQRFSTTTEDLSENDEEYDLNRAYRPSELADLSSLTAVDFGSLKGLNRFNSGSRPRRVRPSSTTTSTQKPEKSLKTASRTLPLARKFLEGTTFGKNRRITSNKQEPVIEDQINSSSDATHRLRPFTRVPYRLSTVASTTEETTRQTFRNRKIIRRLRPTVASKVTTPTETENLIENASSNSLFNRRFTRPTTTQAQEINQLSTTTDVSQTTTTQLPKEDDEQNETSEDVSGEEGENIKLSESIVREINNNNDLNANDGIKVRRKVLKRIKAKDQEEKGSTEPNIIIRTRKIIRKIKPTESTVPTSTESIEISTQNRKRKIIRRFRPTTESGPPIGESTERNLFIRGRPFVPNLTKEKTEQREGVEIKPVTFKSKYKTITRITTPATEPDDAEEEHQEKDEPKSKYFVPSLEKNKYKIFNRATTPATEPDDSEEEHQEKDEPNSKYFVSSLEKNKYKTLNRATTPATEPDDSEEEHQEKVEQIPRHFVPNLEKTKYKTLNRVTTPTTEPDDAEQEHQEKDEPNSKYFVPSLEKNKYKTLNRATTPATEPDDSEEEHQETVEQIPRHFVPNLEKTKYKTLNRATTPTSEPDDSDPTSEPDDSEEKVEQVPRYSVPSLEKAKYKTFNRATTKSPVDVSSQRTIDRSKYSTIKRGPASTLSSIETDTEQQHQEEKEIKPYSGPRYRIYRPTTFHDEDDVDEDENEDDLKEKLLNPPLTTDNNGDVEDHSVKTGILNPSFKKVATENSDDEDDVNEDDNPALTTENNDDVKIRILNPSLKKADAQNSDDEDSVDEDHNEEDLKDRILNPAVTTQNSGAVENDSVKARILHPSLKKVETENNDKEDGVDEDDNEEDIKDPSNPVSTSENIGDVEDDSVRILNNKTETENGDHNINPDVASSSEANTESVTESEHEEKVVEDHTQKDKSDEDADLEEEDRENITTTVRNYVNPILSRQKNRPVFVRPKLTTKNPLRKSTTKPRYRTFSRSTPSHFNKIQSTTETIPNKTNQETERRFVPKNLNRTRYLTSGRENRTESLEAESTSSTTTEPNLSSEDTFSNGTTEIYNPGANNFTDENSTMEPTTPSFVDADEETYNTTILDLDNVSEVNSSVTESLEASSNYYVPDGSDFTSTENATALYTLPDNEEQMNDTTTFNATNDETTPLERTTLPTIETIATTLVEDISENVTNETTTSYIETSTDGADNITPETTPVYHPKSTDDADNKTTETTPTYHPRSTLKSILNRPKFGIPKRLTSTESTTANSRPLPRFSQRTRGQVTQSRLLTPNLRSTTPSAPLINKFLYKYSTTERSRLFIKEKDEEEEIANYDEDISEGEGEEEEEEEEDRKQEYKPKISNSYTPKKSRPRISNRPEAPSFRKTTEASKVSEDLSDIDTEAVKNRNKNLFSKKRKMNTPFVGHVQNESAPSDEKSITATTESTTEVITISTTTTTTTTPTTTTTTTTPVVVESVTKPSTQVFETTEYLTTLHHVFAQAEQSNDKVVSTTEYSTSPPDETNPNLPKSKLERLIEVNRIVEVHGMNNTDVQNENKVVDKVGVINRVTVVKIVDGSPDPEENEITESTSERTTASPLDTKQVVNPELSEIEIATVKEIPQSAGLYGFPVESSHERQDRKFEIYGESKVIDYSSKDIKTKDKENTAMTDGFSNINVITPIPYYSTEASTISLQALFQTDTPQKLNNINANLLNPSSNTDDELLETGNSRFVNIRILGQDKEIKDESQLVPVRVLKDEEYITMKAHVVEVTPKTSKGTIKIVPIQVEMSRKLVAPADFQMNVEKGLPKVNFQIINDGNK